MGSLKELKRRVLPCNMEQIPITAKIKIYNGVNYE